MTYKCYIQMQVVTTSPKCITLTTDRADGFQSVYTLSWDNIFHPYVEPYEYIEQGDMLDMYMLTEHFWENNVHMFSGATLVGFRIHPYIDQNTGNMINLPFRPFCRGSVKWNVIS